MPSEALAKEGPNVHYVYLIESVSDPVRRYVGLTADLRQRMDEHKLWQITAYGQVHAVACDYLHRIFR